jgi:lysophospholipase L1-like esterase
MRIFAKAVVLLLIANFACIVGDFDPVAMLTQINTWGLVGHGRARLAYPSDFQNGQLPIESLLAAHEIAYRPKAADEYRVVVLGESGIAGWGLDDRETFTRQLTARNLEVKGKRVVAYNLAYPSPDAARDLLILNAAARYQPDLVVWFITAAPLDDSPKSAGVNLTFFELNRKRLESVIAAINFPDWIDARLTKEPGWRRWIAIRNQDMLPVWVNTLLYPFNAPDLGRTTRRIANETIPAKARYYTGRPGFESMPGASWIFLKEARVYATSARFDLLVVNEPMLVGKGANSDVNYNLEYERAFYDRYRREMALYASKLKLWYADLWDAIPAESFTDTPFHADAAGYGILVDRIAEIVKSSQE